MFCLPTTLLKTKIIKDVYDSLSDIFNSLIRETLTDIHDSETLRKAFSVIIDSIKILFIFFYSFSKHSDS